MRKWEEKYKEIQSGKLDTRISELQEKMNNKSIKQAEFKELENSKRIKENIPKIENIMEYKTKIQKQLTEIKNEKDRRQSIITFEREADDLEKDLNKLKLEETSIRNQMKTPNLSEEDEKALKAKLSEVMAKENENQEKYSINQLKIRAASKTTASLDGLKSEELIGIINSSGTLGKLGNLSKEELEGISTSISTKISKCNMICNNLINGYSWASIDLKLDQWQDRKFTSEKGVANKIRNAAEVNKQLAKGVNSTPTKDSQSVLPANISEFDKKHPRLAKIKKFFKNAFAKLTDPYNERGLQEQEQEKEKEAEKVEPKIEEDDFKEYIKAVAEKGMKEADRERLEAKKKAAQTKTNENNGREPGE